MAIDYSVRLAALRAELKSQNLDGFLVPMFDEHRNEYPPESAKRVKALTGFSGSAGEVAVLADKAAVFTDGRYQTQIRTEVSASDYAIFNNAEAGAYNNHGTKETWLAENAKPGMRIGYDPWLHTADEVAALKEVASKTGAQLVAVDRNPVDLVWGSDQPAPPATSIFVHGEQYAGESSASKRSRIAADMKAQGIDSAVITDPASVAWLLNVRGNDTKDTPLPISFAILNSDGTVDWFVNPKKTAEHKAALDAHLGSGIRQHDIAAFTGALGGLGGKNVRVDPEKAAFKIFETLESNGAKIDRGVDPSELPRAIKNETEVQGARTAHEIDGIALAKFLEWVDQNAQSGEINELNAAAKLEEFRRANDRCCGLSFPTIMGTGGNGAIIHYHAEKPNKLVQNSFLLVDSGAQYKEGTTDVTRTIAIGDVSDEMKKNFTLVLKGHIQLAMAEFNARTKGPELDAIARKPLNDAGLDYGHGTGHGVGSYLGVHEGPQKIHKASNPQAAKATFKPGMIVSNEPGYYKPGEYGIRIENLVVVQQLKAANDEVFGFETLTLAPIDKRAINADMLTAEERDWLNRYHAHVYEKLSPHLTGTTTQAWLKQATAAL